MEPLPLPSRCPGCGAKGSVKVVARAGRKSVFRGVAIELPATLPLTECTACGEGWLDPAESDAWSDAVDDAYNAELRSRAREALAKIESVTTQRHLEWLLHLSHGYLSKVRNGAKSPSGMLVGHLALIAADPRERIAELERFSGWTKPTPTP